MKNLHLNKILFFMLAFAANNLFGQSVLKIADIKIVSVGEILTIPAGTVVEFGSGAFIKVEGSLIVNGSEENPVIFKNMDENILGLGIVISGSKYESVVQLNHVKFDGLIQPLRFDPFWQRKEVELKNISFWNSISGEPIVYVASPLIDLREGKKIVFTIKNSTCVNNSAGMLLENVGSDAIQYYIDNVNFSDNNATGNMNALGLIHFDFASLYKSANVKVGSLSFTRNYALNNPLGISVAGNGAFSINIDTIYQTDIAEDIIYDKHIDNRIPSVVVGNKSSIYENGSTDIIKSISHNFGRVTLNVNGNPEISKLIDSAGNKVDYTFSRIGDTILLNYIQGLPIKGVLMNGQQVNIPKFIASNDKFLELTKIDTAQYYKFLIENNKLGLSQPQSDEIGFKFKLPIFKRKGEVVKKINTWELGVWGGGAIYGGGDIQPLGYIPSTIELSFGLYQQVNINTRFSMKISGYYTTISSHNFLAAGYFNGTKPIYFYDSLYKRIKVSTDFLPVNFITKMGLLEFEGLWHLRPYKIEAGKNSTTIPSIGLSAGIMYFTPYRIAFVEGQSSTETRDDWENKMYTKHLWDLRKLGSEGQNFLPGKSPYSPIAFNLGTSFSLTYLKKRYALKGEMKFVYTSTDYLDDFGPGIWYGGNYDKMVKSAYKMYDNIPQADMDAITWTPNSNKQKRLGWINPRSTDGLNDWYYQLHLGMSYFIFK